MYGAKGVNMGDDDNINECGENTGKDNTGLKCSHHQ